MKINRDDIARNLEYGDIKEVAERHNLYTPHLSAMLHGRRHQNEEAIKDLELLAAVNVWKKNHCKYESLL